MKSLLNHLWEKLRLPSAESEEAEVSWKSIICIQDLTERGAREKKILSLRDRIKQNSKNGENPYAKNQDGVPQSNTELLEEFLKRNPARVMSLWGNNHEPEISFYDGNTRIAYAIRLGLKPYQISVWHDEVQTTLDKLIVKSISGKN